ncbi:MAG: DNA polymerase III subunit beta [Candidatus Omnitrophota bacterium]
MDVKISRAALMSGIQIVQNAVSQKSSLPILSNVLIEGEKDTVRLTATDLDMGICATIPAEITQEGAITVPAKKFFDIIKNLPEGSDLLLNLKKNNYVTIKSEKAQFKIIGLPKEEFPQLPVFDEKDAISIASKTMAEMFNLTDFAVSRDDTRYVLNGLLMNIKGDKISVVATDGRRLAAVNKTLPQKTLVEKEVIIPTKTVQEVKRMLTEEGEVKIKFSSNQILFSFPGSFIVSRIIEGEYPNYKSVIPEKSMKEIKILREDFLAAARRASIFTDQDSMAVKLSIKKEKMTISKNTPYLGEAREDVDISYTGEEEVEIGFNPRYLIDVLKCLPDKEIIFEVDSPTKPGVVRWGEEYTYVVLPMQLAA